MKIALRLLTNKYIIASIVFIVMVLFFSPYDYFTIRKAQAELDEVNEKIAFLNKESDRMNAELSTLITDTAALERYARELYHQKKEGEDVYVIK